MGRPKSGPVRLPVGTSADAERARSLARIAFESIWERDLRSGDFSWVTGLGMFGYRDDEVADEYSFWQERVHPDDRRRVLETITAMLSRDSSVSSSEFRFRRRDGSWAFVTARATIERDPQGRPIRALCAMMDASHARDLLDAKRTLLASQRVGQMRAWEEDLTTGMVTLDLAAEEPVRVPREEAWKVIDPEDFPRAMALRKRLIESGGSFETEYRAVQPDGSKRVILVRGELRRDAAGRAERLIGVSLDVTDRVGNEAEVRANQRLLQQVLDTLPVGVVLVDRRGDAILSNPASVGIWGKMIVSGPERRRESKGFWHATGGRIAAEEWASVRTLKTGETRLRELIDIETFDGVHKTIENSTAPVRDADGRITGAVVVNEDVTGRVRAQEELARRGRQQEAIAQLSLSALRGGTLQPLFEEASSLVARTLGVEYGGVAEWIPERQQMEFRAGAGPWDDAIIRSVPLPTTPGYMAWFYMRSQTPVVIEDLARETRFAPCELLVAHGVKSGIAVRIGSNEHRFGVLEACSKENRTFTEDEVNFVWSVANVLATTIEQRRGAAELREKREEMQALSRKLIEAHEAERRSIARELHDDFGQVLTAIKLNLMTHERDQAESVALVDGAIARMRDLAQDLRPPLLDELGLEASLRWFVEREARRAGLQLELRLEAPAVRPSAEVETTCFRVVQESITNVIRHAQARRVEVELRAEGRELILTVRDDGKGFDVAAAHRRAVRGGSQGLLGMQERAALVGGTLQVESAPGSGTVVRARLPLAGAGP